MVTGFHHANGCCSLEEQSEVFGALVKPFLFPSLSIFMLGYNGLLGIGLGYIISCGLF